MKPLALALALALAPPIAAAQPPQPEYPDDVAGLLPGWIAEAEAFGAADRDQPWYPEAQAFLDKAKAMAAQNRVRATTFDLETYHELVLAGRLADEAAALGSDAERKSLAIQRANQWHEEALAVWAAYRERLHGLEPEIRALHALELALWSADHALSARLALEDHDLLVRELPKQPGFGRDHVLALARTDHTPLVSLGWANDVLDLAGGREGVPPKLVLEHWTLEAEASMQASEGRVPAHLEALERIAGPVRESREGVLAVAINLAQQRAVRATSISVIFGDAQSRGLDVVNDAARGMNRQLDNTTLQTSHDHSLLGVFTSDAIDRALFMNDFLDAGTLDLGIVIGTWASLDHAVYATATLAAASPVAPPPVVEKPTPLPWGVALMAAGLAALLRGRSC